MWFTIKTFNIKKNEDEDNDAKKCKCDLTAVATIVMTVYVIGRRQP